MMRVKCALPWSSKDIGYSLKDGETEEQAMVRVMKECPHKDIRPCAKWQGWVVKEEACVGCKYCVQVIGN